MDLNRFIESDDSDLPAYKRVSAGIERAIARGELLVGTRLPSERALARQLLRSRATIVAAYDELHRRGMISRQVGRGSFVSGGGADVDAPFSWIGKAARSAAALTTAGAGGAEPAPDPPMGKLAISFDVSSPATDLFPLLEFGSAVSAALHRAVHASPPRVHVHGHPRLRAALAAWVGCAPEEVFVTAGAQQAVHLLARYFVNPKETVIVEEPGHPGAFQAFRSSGARLVGWTAPAWDPGELERLIIRHRPKLVYSNPTFQNPTGATMEIDTRREMLRLSALHGVPIVEDDTYSRLHWNRPAPSSIRDLDGRKVVLRVGTFSMILGPGVRVGYIIAPAQIMDGLAAMKGASAGPSDEVSQQAVAALLRDGAITKHLADLRSEHRRRHEALMRSLEAARLVPRDYVSPGGGLYAWIGFPQDGRRVAGAAARCGVGVGAGSKFFLGGKASRHLRFCFAATPPSQIETGVALLSTAMKGSEPPSPVDRHARG